MQYRSHALTCVAGHFEVAAAANLLVSGRALCCHAAFPIGDPGALRRAQLLIFKCRSHVAAVVSSFDAVDNKNRQVALGRSLDYRSITWLGRAGKFGCAQFKSVPNPTTSC
jgi:hypothetical protein